MGVAQENGNAFHKSGLQGVRCTSCLAISAESHTASICCRRLVFRRMSLDIKCNVHMKCGHGRSRNNACTCWQKRTAKPEPEVEVLCVVPECASQIVCM